MHNIILLCRCVRIAVSGTLMRFRYIKRNMTLAEYYYHTNKHLLGDIIIAEYDPVGSKMRFLNENA